VIAPEDEERDAGRFESLVDAVLTRAAPLVERDVARLAADSPGLPTDALARLVVERGVRRAARTSALTAIPGGVTSAVGVPSVLALQVAMVHAVATVFGEQDSSTARRDLLVVLVGERALDVMQALGMEVPQRLRRIDVDARIDGAREPRLRRALASLALRWARKRAVRSVGRALPLVGAAVAWKTDRDATREIGQRALRYYATE
jgi:hypothetical protein